MTTFLPYLKVKQTLRLLTSSGITFIFIGRNRDFFLGDKFAEETRSVLLPDYEIIDLDGERTLITHGIFFVPRLEPIKDSER